MVDFLVSIAPVIIDDILTFDGKVHLGLLGGAGPHALAGCCVWEKPCGLIAGVGQDLKGRFQMFADTGYDLDGLHFLGQKTTHAWQLFQKGGERIQVLKELSLGVLQALPDLRQLNQKYQQARGYHVLWRGEKTDLFHTLSSIREINPSTVIVMEPTPNEKIIDRAYYHKLFSFIDLYSPNLAEGALNTGFERPEYIINTFLELGCKSIALRMGKYGSIGGLQSGELLKIPTAKAQVVDVTGAGNAFMGGLLCGMAYEKTFAESLALAAVSASFAIQQFGICIFNETMIPLRDARLKDVLKKIKKFK